MSEAVPRFSFRNPLRSDTRIGVVNRVLIRVCPKFLFRTSHHQEVRDHFVGRTHHAGPGVPVITYGMQAKRAQRIPALLILMDGNRGLPFSKEVGEKALVTDLLACHGAHNQPPAERPTAMARVSAIGISSAGVLPMI